MPNDETLQATPNISSLVYTNTQNPYLRPTATSAHGYSDKTALSKAFIEKKDLIPFLKYAEDPLTALERVEQLKPVNLRETVEVCVHSYFRIFLKHSNQNRIQLGSKKC